MNKEKPTKKDRMKYLNQSSTAPNIGLLLWRGDVTNFGYVQASTSVLADGTQVSSSSKHHLY